MCAHARVHTEPRWQLKSRLWVVGEEGRVQGAGQRGGREFRAAPGLALRCTAAGPHADLGAGQPLSLSHL